MSQMRTPLGQVRGLGSARQGTEHFWRQRLTAIANVPLILFFIGLLISLSGASHAEVLETLSHPAICIVMLLMLLAALIHMRLGMQVVIEDYVHGDGAKFFLLILNTFFTVAIGTACVFALLKMAFGG